jgi:CDP-diglyceride synthetase
MLVPCLVVCLYEHRCMVTDQEEWANIINKSFKWVIPFGFYPILVAALFVWGINHADPPSGPPASFWVVIILGWLLATAYVVVTVRKASEQERGRRKKSILLLQTTLATDPGFMAVLKDAFVAFDTDGE